MAKLNVVIPAADVEVIGEGGVKTKYRKVDRDAKRGDIIKITDNDDSSYVIEDAFYTVEYLDGADDPQILDEDGDEYDAGHMEYEVYEKVTEPVASIPDEVAFEGTKYRKVDRSAEEGDVILITELADEDDAITTGGLYRVESLDWAGDPQITDDDGEDFDTCGTSYEVYEKVAGPATQQYREVKRPAKVGERIKIVDLWKGEDRYKAGDEFSVDKVRESDGYVWVDSLGARIIALTEYVVLEPIDSAQPAQPKRLTVGDYAKVIADRTTSDRDPISGGAVGDIVEVVEVDGTAVPYCVKTVEGASVGAKNWARAWALEYVDKAEFLAQKAFKVGDYVKVMDASGASGIAKVGDIGAVTNGNWSGGPIGDQTIIEIETLDGREYGMYAHRFVRATEAEVEAAKQALKYGDFTDYEAAADPRNQFAKGDKVRLISGGGTLGLYDYETGGIYTVSDPKYSTGKIEITGGGQPTAYAKPEQLEKVSAEEIAEIEKWTAIGRKVNEFKPGDLIKIKRNITAAGVDPGEISEVKEVNAGMFGNGVRLTKLNPQGIHAWVGYDDIELIVPVEQRFDREEAA